ncbi:RNase H domain-containing protein [Colletotrichum tofieldiae]|nr:RNase H domain-containing protein [Colletotrichum tofieldiae]GKT73476.1 RNase H domain-containing protein [Colletotrichum tofieldiae]
MAWPEIDYVELPNGRTVTVCAPHQMVTCGKCCLDFSLDFDDDDDDDDSGDDELFGYDFNSPVPRDVSAAQVAGSRYGRPARPASEPLKVDDNEDMDDDEPSGPVFYAEIGVIYAVVCPESAESEGKRKAVEARTFPLAPEKTKHSGIVFASKFDQRRAIPLSPEDLFPFSRSRYTPVATPVKRFINRDNASECLIYTDGACFDNGAAGARGGCAFVFKPVYANDQSGKVAFKLEDRGPDGRLHDRGVKVRFWKIPRQYNHLADRAAKSAASILKPPENFTDITDLSV